MVNNYNISIVWNFVFVSKKWLFYLYWKFIQIIIIEINFIKILFKKTSLYACSMGLYNIYINSFFKCIKITDSRLITEM